MSAPSPLAIAPILVEVLIAAPGAGKSTWAATHRPEPSILCLDTYRAELAGDAAVQSVTPQAVARRETVMRERLAQRQLCVVDATSTVAAHRAALLDTAAAFGARGRAIVLTTGLAECLRRNAARARHVPPAVIERMHAAVTALTARDLYAEGFADVVFVDTERGR